MKIKTAALRKALGSRQAVADFFKNKDGKNIDYQAVYQWGEFIPTIRAHELRDADSRLFNEILSGKYDQ